MILFDALSPDQLFWNNYYEHTCTSNQLLDSLQVKLKPMTVLQLQKKRSVEFQPSQWNSTKKINIRTYLFVLKSSFERISRKKNGSSKTRFETISYSHLASKFSFGEHPYQNLGRPKHPWVLRNIFPERRFKTVKMFSTRFNISFEAYDEAKDTKQQETCCFSTQTNFELKTRSSLLA